MNKAGSLIATFKVKLKNKIERRSWFGRAVSYSLLQSAKWQSSSIFIVRWITKMLFSPIFFLLKDDYYKFLIFSQKHRLNKPSLPDGFRRLSPDMFLLSIIMGEKAVNVDDYLDYLKKINMHPDMQYEWSRRFIEVGRLDLAKAGFISLINRSENKLSVELRLNLLRQTGAVCFMLGDNVDALYYWSLAGKLRRVYYSPTTPKKYKILGPAWFVAIGHIAMLDYYVKFRKLYFGEGERVVAAIGDKDNYSDSYLLKKFKNFGIQVISEDNLELDYDAWALEHGELKWRQLTASERSAMIDDFWEYDFPDGEVLGYAHAAARIQQEWEKRNLNPLFSLDEKEIEWSKMLLKTMGIPSDAWYVCLHVREGGFHQQWNALYPSMRDADVNDYIEAIEKITNAGGWVIRMGDESMKKLPSMKNVVDYAHSDLKTSIADMILVARSRFFLGTNSGFATIAAIYGVPCVLTNWVPVGWPLWPRNDIMISKLFRDKTTGNYLTLQEVYKNNLAFIQNWSSLSTKYEIVCNTPYEIANAADEMLYNLKIKSDTPITDLINFKSIQEKYENFAKTYGAFTGSRFAKSFIQQHKDVFCYSEFESINEGNITICQEQLKDSIQATLN